jgi:hypothetical protein
MLVLPCVGLRRDWLATVLGIAAGLREIAVGGFQQRILVAVAKLAGQGSIPPLISAGFYSSLGTILISVRVALAGWLPRRSHNWCPS